MNKQIIPRSWIWLFCLLLLSQISFFSLDVSAQDDTFGRKDALSSDRKKLDTDLLKLLDPSFRLPGETSDSLVSSLTQQEKYVKRTEPLRKSMTRTRSGATGDLVYLYVYLRKDASVDAVNDLLWEAVGKDAQWHFLAAYVEVSKIEALSKRPEVENLRTVAPFFYNKGTVTAQTDTILKTANIRSTYSQQGNGIKVGVISNGVDHLSEAQATGDLPSAITVLNNTKGGEEGIAMMEIIYDMAPGVSFYFHDSGDNEISYAKAIDALVAAGCKVIVDDVQMSVEPFFENGYLGHHIEVIMEQKDVIFVSAAGNNGNKHYQGAYYDDGKGGHDFSRGKSSDKKYLYGMLTPGQSTYVFLQWDDTFMKSGNDYDLVLYEYYNHTKMGESANVQDGNDAPLETIFINNNTANNFTYQLEIRKKPGASAKTLELNYYVVAGLGIDPANMSPVDSAFGHGSTPNTITVGAISSTDAGYDNIATYSAQGPVTITGVGLRPKPSVVGIADISVSGAGGFSKTFSGTSAAAPGVAGVVAQLWGAFPKLTAAQIRDGIYKSAVDLGTSGFDNIYGYGRVDAVRAYQQLATYAPPAAVSAEKKITAFTIGTKAGVINETNHTIAISLPSGTNVASLAPIISISPKATVSPTSGAVRNFSSPVTYTVTAEDGTKQNYTATVSVAAAPKSSAKEITFFALSGEAGVINETSHTISVTLPPGTSVASLAPTITISPKATVSPTSGTARSFVSPVTYTVTAEDGTKQNYTVTVTVEAAPKSSAKQITAFTISAVSGTINQTAHTIALTLPAGTSLASLVPTITVSPKATISPASGTAKNFSSPVTYTVTAEDGSKQTYTVTVSAATASKSSAKQITSFSLNGTPGTINQANRTITVTLPAGTNLTSLVPDIYFSVKASISPADGTARNFSSPLTYTVTAEDGTKQTYTVTASAPALPKSSEKKITAFIVAGKAGTIDESTHTITLSLSQETNLASLSPDILISVGSTVSPASGIARNFSSPITYTVTAEDGSKQIYTVKAAKEVQYDSEAPKITLSGSSTITVAVGASYREPGVTAYDQVDGRVDVKIDGEVDTDIPGIHTLTYIATDAAGNVAIALRTVEVYGGDEEPEESDSDKAILSFNFLSFAPKVTGIIDDSSHRISLTVPYGANVTALVPTIWVSDEATVSPASGMAQNFAVSRTYVVTSKNGAKQEYVVSVKIDAPREDTVTIKDGKLLINPDQRGTLTLSLSALNQAEVSIPRGSIQDTAVTYSATPATLTSATLPGFPGYTFVPGVAFTIDAVREDDNIHIQDLEGYISVILHVPTLPRNNAPLAIFYFDESSAKWVQVPNIKVNPGTISFFIDHLTTLALFQKSAVLPAGIVDGDIIQCKSSANPQAVYIVKIVGPNAYIRHIVSLEIFNYYKHLKWENLKQVGSLDPFSLSGWVRVNTGPSGTPGPFDKVWEINGDQSKHWINMSAQDFLTHGGSEEAIYSINQGELNLYRVGPDVMSL